MLVDTPLLGEGVMMEKKHMPTISRSRLIQEFLLFGVFSLLTFFNTPTSGYAYTYQDVRDFLTSHPAPSGCYNWTEEKTVECGKGVQVWRRCVPNIVAKRESWISSGSGLQTVYLEHGGNIIACDGANGLIPYPPGAYQLYRMDDPSWFIDYFCNDSSVKYGTGPNGNYAIATPCHVWSVDYNANCNQYDTLLADFVPVGASLDPCCNNPCCGDMCCEQGGSGSGPSLGVGGWR